MAGHIVKSSVEQMGGRFDITREIKGTALTASEGSVSVDVIGSTSTITGLEEVSTMCVATRDFVIDDLLLSLQLGADPEGAIMLRIANPDDEPGEGVEVLDRWVNLAEDFTAEESHLATCASGNAVGATGELADNTMQALDLLPSGKADRYVKRGQRVDIVFVGEANVTMALATLVGDSRTAAY